MSGEARGGASRLHESLSTSLGADFSFVEADKIELREEVCFRDAAWQGGFFILC
jgi:hypothetical protein